MAEERADQRHRTTRRLARANSDDELASIMKRVFESPHIISVLQSRIARATGQAPPG